MTRWRRFACACCGLETRRPVHLTRTRSARGRRPLVAGAAPAAGTRPNGAHALAVSLLERHGVVTRESVLGEGVAGGFAAVYPVLRAWRKQARSAAATSSKVSARRSSPCRARSIACAPSARPRSLCCSAVGCRRSGQSVRRHAALAGEEAATRRRRLRRPGGRRAVFVRGALGQGPGHAARRSSATPRSRPASSWPVHQDRHCGFGTAAYQKHFQIRPVPNRSVQPVRI